MILYSQMTQKPKEFRRVGPNGLKIIWEDQLVQEIPSLVLRQNCPCASCKQARGDTTHNMPITGKKNLLRIVESTSQEQTSLEEIWPVGQYALGIKWGDGHQTGIFTYSLLRTLGTPKVSK